MEHRLDRGPIVLLEAENQAPEFITAFSPVGFFLASNQGIFYDFRKDSRNWIQPLLLPVTSFANQVKKYTERYAKFSL